MKLLRFLTATMFTLSLAGCCCGRNIVMDPCDPCGGVVNQCSGGRPWIFPWNWGSCGYRPCGACASACGCNDYAMDMGCSGGCAGSGGSGGMTSSPGCGCGQTGSFSNSNYPNMNYPNSTNSPYIDGSNGGQTAPGLHSAPEPPISAPTTRSTVPPVIPGSEASMRTPKSTVSQPQMVSYEEFQRLPGTIISGPGAVTSASANNAPSQIQQTSASNQPFLAPPPPSPSLTPSQAIPNNRTNWLPAQPY